MGNGTDPWRAELDTLRAAFREARFGGVVTWAPEPTRQNDQSDKGAYFELTFTAPFHYDFLA